MHSNNDLVAFAVDTVKESHNRAGLLDTEHFRREFRPGLDFVLTEVAEVKADGVVDMALFKSVLTCSGVDPVSETEVFSVRIYLRTVGDADDRNLCCERPRHAHQRQHPSSRHCCNTSDHFRTSPVGVESYS